MVQFPDGFALAPLKKSHPRAAFESGQPAVDRWLRGAALQAQDKRLASTRVLLDDGGAIAGVFTLASAQVDFGALPGDVAKKLPKRALPVAVLAWLGVGRAWQGQGLGARLLAQALNECHAASTTFPFVAVILDCVDDQAKAFYARWSFRELPGQPLRLFLSAAELDALAGS